MPTGSNIKKIRIEKGLTQKQLGDKCGMADSAIRRYENGKANPKLETLQKIANALACSVSDLLETYEPEFGKVIDLTGFETSEQMKLALIELVKNKTLDYQNATTGEIKHIRVDLFLDYLESVGYKLSIDNEGKLGDQYYIGIQDDSRDNVTFFSKKEFEKFEKEIEKAIDYEIFKQYKNN